MVRIQRVNSHLQNPGRCWHVVGAPHVLDEDDDDRMLIFFLNGKLSDSPKATEKAEVGFYPGSLIPRL